jgi:hypothetical protein
LLGRVEIDRFCLVCTQIAISMMVAHYYVVSDVTVNIASLSLQNFWLGSQSLVYAHTVKDKAWLLFSMLESFVYLEFLHRSFVYDLL